MDTHTNTAVAVIMVV